ncbi:LysR family transcriptional regulator [Streptomyces sp. VRA16 Mangrove soil]|uniref:LysR family transcriptional regulator n=1 Tax=Streptomyces sp. VRA16 Mangrove soil TaxID=2817434 RepID=UPI001A9EC248|nr:LysR family transcriptional regulator [Streptomyces sp. VRA16 Mangrove soil]
MELRQVKYFVAVAEELHFGRAAERLHIVQPTVSQQVRRLEREFGLELFDRTSRSVRLTGAGRAFLPHARAILAAERAAAEAMDGVRAEQETTLRVGTNVGLGLRLDGVLTVLSERAPQLLVELVSGPGATRLQQVRDGELDATFLRGPDADPDPAPGLELLPLWRDVLVAALPAAHPLAGRDRVDLADLAELPLRIAPRAAHPALVDAVLDACRAAGFEPVMGPAFTTDQDTLAAIAAGRPSWTVYFAAQAAVQPAHRIAFRPFADRDTAPGLRTYLAVRPGPPSRRLAALLDACHAQDGALDA